MSGFHIKSFVLILPIILCLAAPSVVLPESEKKQSTGSEKAPIVINADSLEVDDTKKVVTFTGHVDARENELTMTCEKLLLYYMDRSAEGGSENTGVRIDRIVATGDVKVIRPGGGLAVAEKAIYYQTEEKIVLTGNPKVKQGDDFVEGDKITLFMRENRSVVEGKVRAVYHPRGDKGVPRGR